MSTDEKSDLLQPIDPEQPQALSQSPVESVPPLPQREKLFGVRPEEIPMVLVDKECGKCFGRGFTGTYADGSVKPCVCALKELRRRHALAIAEATKKETEK